MVVQCTSQRDLQNIHLVREHERLKSELQEMRAQISQQGQLACFVSCTHAYAVTRYVRPCEKPNSRHPRNPAVVRKHPHRVLENTGILNALVGINVLNHVRTWEHLGKLGSLTVSIVVRTGIHGGAFLNATISFLNIFEFRLQI